MTTDKLIIGFSGSLRRGSLNTALLKEAAQLLPDNYTFVLANISALPLYNQELEAELPATITELAELCKKADGFLISTPEYNGSVPGGLKNALDWLSRAFLDTPLATKPVAIMGATPGLYGTSRAQFHLRDILFYLNMETVNRPEILLGQANTKFDESLTLTDEMGKKLLNQLMDNFTAKVDRV